MSNILNLDSLSHRSRDRIKNLGEVFTPESYVEEMLNLLARDNKKLWFDEDIVFFEPCSGHGNIVISIYKRRLEAIYKKAISQGNSEAPYYAVANALNSLWAIDIDSKNIENCRSRVLATTFEFLKSKQSIKDELSILKKNKDFFAHILSAIRWQIFENETLSALSTTDKAKNNAHSTKSGGKWFSKNGHHQLDFDTTWVKYYESAEERKIVPAEYQRSFSFIKNILEGKTRGFDEYDFAKVVLQNNKDHDEKYFSIGA
jgi:hypothetical protein